MKKIFVINGSASEHSSNEKLIDAIEKRTTGFFDITVFNTLKQIPHFDPELSVKNTPQAVSGFRSDIANADGVIICTPEYVFSIPAGLKNAIEWCVATTVFSEKPVGIITASASGTRGHEELQLIMRTLYAKCIPGTTLLIRGIKGKLDEAGNPDTTTAKALERFIQAFKNLLDG